MNSVPECIAQSLRVSVEANTLPVTFVPGEVVSYLEMCREEGVNLQRGMNFRIRGQKSGGQFPGSVTPGKV
jgi:hypothetical protein